MLKLIPIFLIVLMFAGCTQTKNTTKITFADSSLQLNAQIANTSKTRAQGLMFSEFLPQDNAMLFIYPQQSTLSFWMANTKIPLDIIFLDKNKIIVDIQQMPPCAEPIIQNCPIYKSKKPAKYAIELNQNLTKKYNLHVGQKANWD